MKKMIVIMLAVALMLSVVACSGQDDKTVTETPGASAETTPSNTKGNGNEDQNEHGETELYFPLATPIEVSIWWPFFGMGTNMVDYNDNLVFQELTKRLNVTFKFDNPSIQTAGENFNLMIMSGDYPDCIHMFSVFYNQGIDRAIADGVIVALNDFTNFMPNIERYRNATTEIAQQTITDTGNIWCIPHIDDVQQGTPAGMMVRQDLLDKYSLDVPVTIDDWEETLTFIKEAEPTMSNGPLWLNQYGATSNHDFSSAYNIPSIVGARTPFIVIDGKVIAAALQPSFKDYLIKMNDWVNKGLIYKDFLAAENAEPDTSLALNDEIFAWGATYTQFKFYESAKPYDSFKVVGIPSPVLNKGDRVHIRQFYDIFRSNQSMVISTACDELETVIRMWDWLWTDEGIILSNYGVEGYTFNYDENGKPVYTELLTNNPDGLSMFSLQVMFTMFMAPSYNIWQREWIGAPQSLLDAYEVWNTTSDHDYMLPVNLTLTEEEGSEYANIMGDINTYVSEYMVQFISGAKPLSEIDAFMEQLRAMGIERAAEIYQAAYDRYQNRMMYIKGN